MISFCYGVFYPISGRAMTVQRRCRAQRQGGTNTAAHAYIRIQVAGASCDTIVVVLSACRASVHHGNFHRHSSDVIHALPNSMAAVW
jgi:hypothetical protein